MTTTNKAKGRLATNFELTLNGRVTKHQLYYFSSDHKKIKIKLFCLFFLYIKLGL